MLTPSRGPTRFSHNFSKPHGRPLRRPSSIETGLSIKLSRGFFLRCPSSQYHRLLQEFQRVMMCGFRQKSEGDEEKVTHYEW